MDLNIHVTKNSGAWNQVKSEIEKTLQRTLSEFDQLKGVTIHVDVTLTDDPEMQIINQSYRGKDKPTNVLSFPQFNTPQEMKGQKEILLGDIVLSYTTIKTEAREQEKTFENHFTHLLVHGCLHLLGFDHVVISEADKMEALEIMILEKLGIPNPYNDEAECL